MDLSFAEAAAEDAAAIAEMRTAVGAHLTTKHGRGPWSSAVSERGVLLGLHAHSRVLVARSGGVLLGSLRLASKKPWAIDPTYFTAVRRPLHLTDMAVTPDRQRQGVGRRLLEYATGVARSWPGDAIRLDAFDSPAGAGGFYASCGYRETGRVTYRGTPLIYFELVL